MSYIICGFYTPDYAHWLPALRASLDAVGAPHDFVETPKVAGSWETNTMRKAAEVLAAMDRHPDKVIIFLDVDCVVRGDLSPLARVNGDVAFYVRTRRRKSGGAPRFGVRSGTLVIRPTPAARKFVETWAALSSAGHYGDVDQTTMMLAIGLTPGVCFTPLEHKWCAAPSDGTVAGAVILHDSASADITKIGKLRRFLYRFAPWLVAREPQPYVS